MNNTATHHVRQYIGSDGHTHAAHLPAWLLHQHESRALTRRAGTARTSLHIMRICTAAAVTVPIRNGVDVALINGCLFRWSRGASISPTSRHMEAYGATGTVFGPHGCGHQDVSMDCMQTLQRASYQHDSRWGYSCTSITWTSQAYQRLDYRRPHFRCANAKCWKSSMKSARHVGF